MANRFGSSYEFEQQIKNDSPHDSPHPHSSTHEQVHQLARNKKEILAQKAEAKAERETKKEYIASGSGHDHKIDAFLSPPAGRRNKRSSSIVKHESIMLHLKQKRAHGVAKSFFGRGGGKSGFNHNNEKEE